MTYDLTSGDCEACRSGGKCINQTSGWEVIQSRELCRKTKERHMMRSGKNSNLIFFWRPQLSLAGINSYKSAKD